VSWWLFGEITIHPVSQVNNTRGVCENVLNDIDFSRWLSKYPFK